MLKMVYLGFFLVFFFNVSDQISTAHAADKEQRSQAKKQIDSLSTEKEKLIKKAYNDLGIFEDKIKKLRKIEEAKKEVAEAIAEAKRREKKAEADKKAYNDRIRKLVLKYTAKEKYSDELQRELNKVMGK